MPGGAARLLAILDAARGRDDTPVEVFASDALARPAADAGDLGAARSLSVAADAHALRGVI